MDRAWAMADKQTFHILPIKKLISAYKSGGGRIWIDPFPYPYKKDAKLFLCELEKESVDGCLFDPPYSPRQLKECYNSLGLPFVENYGVYFAEVKDLISRVIKPGGICISFGWNSNGLGKCRGFQIEKILLVPHGGMHNDTIVTVERKVNFTL